MIRYVVFFALTILLALPGTAGAEQKLFYTDFEDGVPREVSPIAQERLDEGPAGKVLGLFNTKNHRHFDSAELELEDLPPNATVRVEFDLVLVGNWDSTGKLADEFWVEVEDGPVIFEMTEFPCKVVDGDEEQPIGNDGLHKPYGRNLGYWIVPVSLEIGPEHLDGDELTLEFDSELSGKRTEFFALDNMRATLLD
jgi:hypothetical protein